MSFQAKDIYILPQCAAAGDLSPRLLHYKKARARKFYLKYGDLEHTRAERRDIAERLVQAFNETLDWAKKDIKSDITIIHRIEAVELSKRIITDEEYSFAKKGIEALSSKAYLTEGKSPEDILFYNSKLYSELARYQKIIDRYKTQTETSEFSMEIHVVKAGDIAFASNWFELFVDYMHRIQARSPFEQTMLFNWREL